MNSTSNVLQQMEAVLEQRRRELAELEAAATLWRALLASAPAAPAPPDQARAANARRAAKRVPRATAAPPAAPARPREVPGAELLATKVLDVLRRARALVTKRDVADRLPGVDVDEARAVLRMLVARGAIVQRGNKFSTRYGLAEFAVEADPTQEA